MKSRIFILEDHPIMRWGYRTLINGEMDIEVCGEAETAAEALEKIPRAAPDLVIVDISLEGMNGIEFIKHLQAERPGVEVLVVSMHEESVYAERALQAGVRGYLTKTEADSCIIPAIERVLAGHYYISGRMKETIMRQFAGGRPPRATAGRQGSIAQLSDRELEVFELQGRGLRTREIAAAMNISPKTVGSHQGHIKTKLAIDSMPELVRRAVLWIENGEAASGAAKGKTDAAEGDVEAGRKASSSYLLTHREGMT